MNQGRIWEEGELERVLGSPETPELRGFLSRLKKHRSRTVI